MFLLLFSTMITNINKERYLDLLKTFKRDKKKLKTSILTLRKNKNQVMEVKVKTNSEIEEYFIRLLKNREDNTTVAVYSNFPGYLVVWPSELLYSEDNLEPYIILIKEHAIQRYAERYLKSETIDESIKRAFIDGFCLSKTPVMIKKSETDKVDSLMCRIKDGALLGFSYKVNPRVLRFNTFVSDRELDEANREDQKRIRIGGETWEKMK